MVMKGLAYGEKKLDDQDKQNDHYLKHVSHIRIVQDI